MHFWFQWLSILWPIAATITPVLIAIGLLWLRTKFADVKAMATLAADVGAIKSRLDVIDVRLADVDADLDGEPTRLQVLQKISEVSERLARVEVHGENHQLQLGQQINALSNQLKTQGDYIQAVVERGMQ
jgi:hypothetical protein